MREAAEHLRAGHDPGDQSGARASAAQLLDQLADRDERDAGLADRILTTPPGQMLHNGHLIAPATATTAQAKPSL